MLSAAVWYVELVRLEDDVGESSVCFVYVSGLWKLRDG